MFGRKIGTLQKLIDTATVPDSGVKWKHVLEYLEDHCDEIDDAPDLPFDSPLPSHFVACSELKAELRHDRSSGESLLRNVLHKIPPEICAALCQLGPSVLRATCPRDRLPIQYACRYPVSPQLDEVIVILAKACPESLIHRDHLGQTAVHYLFLHHAPQRSPALVASLCSHVLTIASSDRDCADDESRRDFPLPPFPSSGSAAVVHDAVDGSLPLHYAVMNGASLRTIHVLLQAHPASQSLTDRYGRTALHRYLGAGSLGDDAKDVSGEPWSGEPWWRHPISKELVQMLTSSRVARTTDCLGRTPLHWACVFVAYNYFHDSNHLPIQALQSVLASHVGQLATRDAAMQTPLMVLFGTMNHLQRTKKPKTTHYSLIEGGLPAFTPSSSLMDLLLKHPDDSAAVNIATLEDSIGRLPLHLAVECAVDLPTIEVLLQYFPNALVHATEEMKVPLHSAFTPFAAPRQSAALISLLLQQYEAGTHGTVIDGRLGLKMEDSSGMYPLHYVVKNKACLNIIELIMEKYPQAALQVGPANDLPAHNILTEPLLSIACGSQASSDDNPLSEASYEEYDVASKKSTLLLRPLTAEPRTLMLADSQFGMLPLHLTAMFEALPYANLLRMLQLNPDAALHYSTHGRHAYSPLDLHDMRQPRFRGTQDEWQHIRELLYSFGPTLGSHRHRQGLLSQCVRLIVDELNGNGAFHLDQGNIKEECETDLEISHSLSNLVLGSVPESRVVIPKQLKRSHNATATKQSTHVADDGPDLDIVPNSSSIYDEENTKLDYDLPTDADAGSTTGSEDSHSQDEYLSSDGDDDEEEIDYQDEIEDLPYQKRLAKKKKKRRGVPTDEGHTTNVDLLFEEAKSRANTEKRELVNGSGKEVDDYTGPPNNSSWSPTAHQKPRFISEVAFRLWTFFSLYCDLHNPNDNYSMQVGEILEEIDFDTAQTLSTMSLPPFAAVYFPPNESLFGSTFRDRASPKCRELIYKTCYFLGKYEFDKEDDILIHRSDDGSSLLVQAFEWIFTTETETDARRPGISEEQIWTSGELPADVGATFSYWKRPVWMKFTKRLTEYRTEVEHRAIFDIPADGGPCPHVGVSPLLSYYSAMSSERKQDRIYKHDTGDNRFKSLTLYGRRNSSQVKQHELTLKDYPFALVYPASSRGTLHEYLMEYGPLELDEIRSLARNLLHTLSFLHDKGFVHGQVTTRNICLCGYGEAKQWCLQSLSCLTKMTDCTFFGSIKHDGFIPFNLESLPPEFFVSLSPSEYQIYKRYWSQVEKLFGVQIAASALQPVLDFKKGTFNVGRCFFESQAQDTGALPSLPYALALSNRRLDFWALGYLIFTLMSGISNLDQITRQHIDDEELEHTIYEHILDPLAQDFLVWVLATKADPTITCETILSHPFLDPSALNRAKIIGARTKKALQMKQKRMQEMERNHEKA
jgi:serine/threonine protein kinase/ankyrin repeat protein